MKWMTMAPVILGLVAALVSPTTAEEIRTRIAKTYGVDAWDNVEELRYTFNVKSGEREVRRSWVWRPADRR